MSKAILGRKLGMTQIFTEEGKVVPVEDVIALSKVPSKEDLISKTLYCILSPLQGLAIALQAIADKKSEGAEAPAAEAAAE